MPKAGEEQVSKRNKKSSPGTTTSHSSDKSTKKSSIGVRAQPLSSRDAEESGQDRGGSPTSIKRCQTKSPNKGHHSQIANECTKILNVPLPLGPTRQAADTSDKRTAPSAAGLVNQQLRRRKKQIVNTLMAVILECLDKKLEALEEACDAGEHYGSRASQASSSGSRGKPTSKTAGQKRQLHRDDQEDSSNEGGGEHPDRDKKRAKIVLEVEPGRFACPYYKYNQERFGNQRTCCGPGWIQVHRVKEHIKRSHGLPKYRCNRCCELFREEEDLKTHQRQAKPCPVIDPASIPRDLADGFDQEQQDKLKSRNTKTAEEKWKEWYCILFNLDPKSDEIPSPYHDAPCDNRSLSGSGHDGNFKNYVEYYREQVTPVIYHHVEQEVEKAIMDVEERVKMNVMNRIKGIPAMIHRLIQSIPPPPGEGAGSGFVEMPVPPEFDPDDIFEGLNFDEADGFDFDGMDGSTVCFEATESSGSSSFSGSRYPMASSNTSVDDETYGIQKITEEPYQQALPGLPEYDYASHCYPV